MTCSPNSSKLQRQTVTQYLYKKVKAMTYDRGGWVNTSPGLEWACPCCDPTCHELRGAWFPFHIGSINSAVRVKAQHSSHPRLSYQSYSEKQRKEMLPSATLERETRGTVNPKSVFCVLEWGFWVNRRQEACMTQVVFVKVWSWPPVAQQCLCCGLLQGDLTSCHNRWHLPRHKLCLSDFSQNAPSIKFPRKSQ